MKKSFKWIVGIFIILLVIFMLIFFKPVKQAVYSSSSSFSWMSGSRSSNEVQLPDVVIFSSSMRFFDYSIEQSFAPNSICSMDSSGRIVRGCCVQYKVFKNGVLIDSIPSSIVPSCLDVSSYKSSGYIDSGVDSSGCSLVSKSTSQIIDTRLFEYGCSGSYGSSALGYACKNRFGSALDGYVLSCGSWLGSRAWVCTKSGVVTDVKGGMSAPKVEYLSSSLVKSYGIMKVNFFTSSHYNSGSSVCAHVDSNVDFVSTPDISVGAEYVSNVSFGAPLSFKLNIVNNWSYPVKAVLSVKYSTSNFLGSIDKTVNRTVDVPIGKSSQDFSIDLGGYSGSLFVTPSLLLFVDESNFVGLNTRCVVRRDSTVWDGLVSSSNCVGVPVSTYSGDTFKVVVSPNTIVVENTNVVLVNNTIETIKEVTTNKIPPIFYWIVGVIVLIFLIVFIVLIKRK